LYYYLRIRMKIRLELGLRLPRESFVFFSPTADSTAGEVVKSKPDAAVDAVDAAKLMETSATGSTTTLENSCFMKENPLLVAGAGGGVSNSGSWIVVGVGFINEKDETSGARDGVGCSGASAFIKPNELVVVDVVAAASEV